MIDDDPWKIPLERERAMRFAADFICLWCLCDDPACRRATACRGDVQICCGRVAVWIDAIDASRRVCPSFAALESRLETPAELRAYRLCRRFWPKANAAPPKAPRR